MRILVAVASQYGSTRGIAEAIGGRLPDSGSATNAGALLIL